MILNNKIKFHTITLTTVIILAYISSFAVNLIIKHTLLTTDSSISNSLSTVSQDINNQPVASALSILESNFFKKAEIVASDDQKESTAPASPSDLALLGTITGPRSIARALVKKKGEASSELFKIGQDIYGYTLTWIDDTKIYLKQNDQKLILDMYPPKDAASNNSPTASSKISSSPVKTTLSRSELQQNLKNNMDNMLKGLRVAPYRKDGAVVGYKLKRVSSQNMLYKYGLRSGDILKKINGHQITSTAKLYELWQAIPTESRLIIDIERKGAAQTFEFTIND